MAIQPDKQPTNAPNTFVPGEEDIPHTFGPYTEAEKELARSKQELAKMHEADNKRKSRNKWIGGGVAGLLLAGGGVFAGSKLAGGESPEPTQPAAEAPANPGEVEAPVDNPAPEPTVDIPAEPETPVEAEPTEVIEDPNVANFSVQMDRYTYMNEGGEVDDLREFYSGLDHDWVIGSAPEAGRAYVENFLYEKGAITPISDYANLVDKTTNGWAVFPEGEEMVNLSDAANNNITTILNVYLANKDQWDMSLDDGLPQSKRVFDGMGTYLIRGMAETGVDNTICKDEFDCPSAIDHVGFRQLIEAADELPEGSVIVGAQIVPMADEQNRHNRITLHYADGDSNEVVWDDARDIVVENHFMLYPTTGTSSEYAAASLNDVYSGESHGDGTTALVYMENEDAIKDKVTNRSTN